MTIEKIFSKIVGGPPTELQQDEIIPKFINAVKTHDYIVLRVPTGNGKTSLVAAYGEHVGDTLFLTNSIVTQDSIENTGKRCGFDWTSMKGQSQYPCILYPEKTVGDIREKNKSICSDCVHRVQDMITPPSNPCEYFLRAEKIKTSRISILSFDKFLADFFYTKNTLQKHTLVIDECDLFTDKVAEYLTIEISRSKLDKMKVPPKFDFSTQTKHTIESVLDYLESIQNDVQKNYIDKYREHLSCLKELQSREHVKNHVELCGVHKDRVVGCSKCKKEEDYIENESMKCTKCYTCKINPGFTHEWFDVNPREIDEFVDRLNSKIKHIRENPENFVYYPQDEDQIIRIKPIDVKPTIKNLIYGYRKVIFISATCSKEFFNERYGLKNAKFIDIEKTSIPVTSRPIYNGLGYFLKSSNIEENIITIASYIYLILDSHKNNRGIIFVTGNYTTRKSIKNLLISKWPENKSDVKGRFIVPNDNDSTEKVLDDFKKYHNSVLVISCFSKFARGINFSDDDCRFQVIVKHPKPNFNDPILKERERRTPGILRTIANNTLIQSIGRGVRHKDDWCNTFLLDGFSYVDLGQEYTPKYLNDSLRTHSFFKIDSKGLFENIQCGACQKKILDKYEVHHIQYPVIWNGVLLESITCNAHIQCHSEIHHTDKYLHLKPPQGQSRKYYGGVS